jgi:Fe-S oxidoreductase
LVRLAADDPRITSLFRDDLSLPILVHAHCHQKAIAGAEPTIAALNLVPGYEAKLIETGCCGMAGSFGFEAEHYEISRAMGAYKLFPVVEAAGVQTQIAITGVSCRQQIGHFTSRVPRHAVELLADALR